MRNLFCDHDVLRNEADVEQNFARRLIEALGYSDVAIRPKTALESLTIGNVGTDRLYRPDFAMKAAGHIRWILEAKSPGVRLDAHTPQARGYCEAINAAYSTASPVKYFVLTNGLETHVYEAAETRPALTLSFGQFVTDDSDYSALVRLLRPAAFVAGSIKPEVSDIIAFSKPTINEINLVFSKCHQFIHQSDKISQAKGFEEFVKLITLKLLSDKAIRDQYPGLTVEHHFDHPAADVEFSMHWLRRHETTTPNPVDSILFRRFMDDVETQIARRVRKRFFDQGEQIQLKPETIRGVVKRLEAYYLYGIDADLNGRLFENFLSATMRGKDLGQYFTPRTLVKLGVGLGNLNPKDMVLDGSCGTGGFLIDALADMWTKVNRNVSLSEQAKANERKTIADSRIFGIDFAKSPNLAKIARLNMYLHGDGGSRIFNIDGLDLKVRTEATDSPEEITEKDEFRQLDLAGRFDIVLTNPPFSKKYERKTEGDARILDQYVVASGRSNLLAKLMFFEMYHHYLAPGGRLISVIDDGFLSGDSHRGFRKQLRRMYLIKAVVSLPGDAFQRSDARVKTSFVVLEKRRTVADHDEQPSVFMYACRYVGLDDPKRTRWMPGDDELRSRAKDEMTSVVREYQAFLDGNGDVRYIVPANRVAERLDVKNCLVTRSWRSMGKETGRTLSDVAELKVFGSSDTIDCMSHGEYERLFTVQYDGTPRPGRSIIPRTETQYAELYRVRTGDIVISNIAASYGSVAVVPTDMAGMLVSKEYTVLRAKKGYDPRVVCAVLRSPELRAEMLVRSTGANRTRVRWSEIEDVDFPYPKAKDVERFVQCVEEAEAARRKVQLAVRESRTALNQALGLDQESAHAILDAFRPPK